MTGLLVDLGALALVLTLLVGALSVWRIGHVVSWRALAMTAWATHSFTDCVDLIRFCAEARERGAERRSLRRQGAPQPGRSGRLLEGWPRAS